MSSEFNRSRRFAGRITQLLEIDKDPVGHWRSVALRYWRRYLGNLATIQELRRQNRVLRNFLGDILPSDLVAEFNDDLTRPGKTLSDRPRRSF